MIGRDRSRRVWWLVAVAAIAAVAVLAVWLAQVGGSRPGATETATPAPTSTAASTLRPDVQTVAQRRLDEHLEECVAQGMRGSEFPPRCGIEIPWGTDFTRVDGGEFRIERLPVLEITDAGFVADGGVLVATLTGIGHDGADRTETYRTETWSVRGDLHTDGDDVTLSVW